MEEPGTRFGRSCSTGWRSLAERSSCPFRSRESERLFAGIVEAGEFFLFQVENVLVFPDDLFVVFEGFVQLVQILALFPEQPEVDVPVLDLYGWSLVQELVVISIEAAAQLVQEGVLFYLGGIVLI